MVHRRELTRVVNSIEFPELYTSVALGMHHIEMNENNK